MATDSTEIQRGTLPIPDLEYTGTVTYDATDPDTSYPPIRRLLPPDGAPNVLVILVDDTGFGASSSFGGPVETPNFERVAAQGLKYTRFHTTALCSPTRAALLSGRNHHTVGMGGITEIATSAPGYSSLRPNNCAPLAEILKLNGYNTAQFGKCHEVPVWESSPVGPFDHWPHPGGGFEYFYGFVGGETNQWYPAIYENTSPLEPWGTPEEGYHFMADMADKAIAWTKQQKALAPDKPFFTYFAPGATHAPHHVPKEWADKYRGKFDQGWDTLREETFARQKELGVVPQDATLTARSPGIPAWEEMSEKLRPALARQMEVYAGFLAYTDHHVGRVLDSLEDLGVLDDTLVYVIIGDNGASAEGTMKGTTNESFIINHMDHLETEDYMIEHIDDLGTPDSYNHYAIGWAHAMDTPYQWTKQVASHWGGTRNGTIVSWPNGIAARGEIRHQFAHVIDVAPTVLAAAGIPEPSTVHGVTQRPFEGTAMNYSFDAADAPEQHETQYFEMFGNRAIFHKGWTAVAKHKDPWLASSHGLDADVWELYNVEEDWTQSHDLADEYPDKLADLQRLFLIQAARFKVLPMDTRSAERFNDELVGRPTLIQGTSQTFYPGMKRLSENSVINVKNKSHSITAKVTVPESGANGVILVQGGAFGGWSVYTKDCYLKYTYNVLGLNEYTTTSDQPLSPGDHEVRMEFDYEGGGLGKGGTVTLYADGHSIGSGKVERTLPFMFSMDETVDVGIDVASPVSSEYGPTGNGFTGDIAWARIDIGDDDHSHLADPEHRMTIAMTKQ
ncbi:MULTISPECIES: arylsulfatase [unclassified Rhodococcus (in: high G+C Gram-positive bacteria)]|uniref:arylsulfatase n=1 Tax=unclassified Rhodococcus (in: high G+C Gram-positive bacteria) TaxID=192944 RepID=UPI00077A96BA|nr:MULTISPECIES: arylsulfatase [unclassified Rhodococcus (in: high G+C Gram-positive bacteria)]KXX59883.1 arylsulfatase [Rhodococcus sp. LB1]PBC54973.1 arylsulfatase [Rhodococcus sp. ACPA1]